MTSASAAASARSDRLQDLLRLAPVIPVITIERVEDGVPLARALVSGGLRLLEITLRTPAGRDAAAAIIADVPEAVVGIGTVLTPQDLARSRELGARFALSPGATPELLDAAAAERFALHARGRDRLRADDGARPRLRHRQVLSGGAGRRHRRAQGAGRTVPAGPLLPDGRRERGQRGRVARACRTSSWSAAPGSPRLARSAPARGIGLASEPAERPVWADNQRGGAATTDERPRCRPK